jgi:UPF0755 protein
MTDEPDPRPNPRPQPPPASERELVPVASTRPQDVVPSATPDAAPTPAVEPRPRGERVAPVVSEPPYVAPGDYGAGGYDGGDDDGPWDDEWVPLPPRSGPLRRAGVVMIVLALIVGVTGFSVVRWVNREIHPPGDPGAAVEFSIEPGDTTNVVANNLASEDVIGNSTVFRYWLRRQGGEQTFRAGKYDLFERMDYPDVLEVLRNGPRPPVLINVLVPPGLTLEQMKADLLAKMPGFDPAELDAALLSRELDKDWVPPYVFGLQSREGVLFPDTYSIDEETASNERALVARMSAQMDTVLAELGAQEKADALGRSLYEIVIIASLIEEEAKIDADRPKIARVIYNRLERGTPLGIDATTRYELNKFGLDQPLVTADFESDSPFNTRRNPGLPPTPIASPTRASLEAALNPTPGERWLYYVLTNEGDVLGAHTFANTAREFEAAKRICIEKDLGCG